MKTQPVDVNYAPTAFVTAELPGLPRNRAVQVQGSAPVPDPAPAPVTPEPIPAPLLARPVIRDVPFVTAQGSELDDWQVSAGDVRRLWVELRGTARPERSGAADHAGLLRDLASRSTDDSGSRLTFYVFRQGVLMFVMQGDPLLSARPFVEAFQAFALSEDDTVIVHREGLSPAHPDTLKGCLVP